MEIKLELINVPVSDVDRAKRFYVEKAGFNADVDQRVNEKLRFVQLTPPGSACSISIGTGFSEMEPGSVRGLQVVVKDIREAKKFFEDRGLDVGEVEDFSWGKFVNFEDPDGNKWAVQEIPPRG